MVIDVTGDRTPGCDVFYCSHKHLTRRHDVTSLSSRATYVVVIGLSAGSLLAVSRIADIFTPAGTGICQCLRDREGRSLLLSCPAAAAEASSALYISHQCRVRLDFIDAASDDVVVVETHEETIASPASRQCWTRIISRPQP